MIVIAPPRRCRERGQALVMGLFLGFAVAGVALLMFNSGRALDEKLRVTNAADVVAYSVATLEARALNYDAYSNRAIVANQVAIAQAISLVSWLHAFEAAVDNADALAGVAASWLYHPDAYPRLALLLGGVSGTAYLNAWAGGSLGAIVAALDTALADIVDTHDAVAQALSASQEQLHASMAAGAAQHALANSLVRRIDPAMRAELNPASHDFGAFTQRLGRGTNGRDERGRLADVVMRSLDAFSRERKWTLSGPNIPFVQRNVQLKRRGGTELIGYDEWRALDTIEHQGQRWRNWRWRWRRTPIAWGAASASTEGASATRGLHGRSYRDNVITSLAYAEPAMLALRPLGGRFSGLPGTRELRNLAADAPHRSGITLRVAKPRAALRTAGGNAIVQPSGRLAQFAAPVAGDEMVALARAEAFFERPSARADARAEQPGLYSPFWQVRLARPDPSDRAWAAARQDGMTLP